MRFSVIVPARNEEGNVENIFNRVPQMGGGTELIFVEGHSKDDTYGAIERAIAARPGTTTKLFRQPGKGKGDAVRKGFAEASGDVLFERWNKRIETGERHEGHVEAISLEEIRRDLSLPYEPLSLPGYLLKVDTTDPAGATVPDLAL